MADKLRPKGKHQEAGIGLTVLKGILYALMLLLILLFFQGNGEFLYEI